MKCIELAAKNRSEDLMPKACLLTKYAFFNVAYRFLVSKKSFIYTITDFGQFKDLNASKKALSIGAGYQFLTNNSQINLHYALGKINNQPFDYKTSTLNVNFITYF